jgi:putative membrane protein
MSEKLRAWSGIASCVFAVAQIFGLATFAQSPGQPPSSTRSTGDRPATTEPRPMNRDLQRTMSPQAFTEQAAVIGQAEVELGKVAMNNAGDAKIREYAERLVKDHTEAAAKLNRIAAKEGLQVPQTLDGEHQALKQKLSGLKGSAFDREYTKAMAKGHDKAVALFEAASQGVAMPDDLKEFAAATLPTLEQHRELAHSLHGKKEGA